MILPAIPAFALVQRELLVTLRRKRTILLLILLPTLIFFVAEGNTSELKMLAKYSDVATLSRYLVDIFFAMALLGGMISIPGLCGGAIVSERQNDTFDLLHGALLGPRGIVLGKLINGLGFYTLLLIGMLPILGVVFFLVGISWGELINRFLVLYLSLTACAAIGLWCSTIFRRPVLAVGVSYFATIFIYVFLPYLLMFFLQQVRFVNPKMPFMFIPTLNISEFALKLFLIPFQFWDYDMYFPGNGIPGMAWLSGYTVLHGCVFLFVTVIVLWRTLRVLSRPPKNKIPNRKPIIDDAAALEARRKRFPYYLFDPCKRRPMIKDGKNPLLAKEFRCGFLGQSLGMIRTTYLVFFVYCPALVIVSTGNLKFALSAMQVYAIIFVAPVLIGGIFPKEREQGNLDMLRMTTLSAREIVHGKAGGAFLALLPILITSILFTILLPFICWYMETQYPLYIQFVSSLMLVSITLFSVILCLFISSKCKNTIGGVLGAYSLTVVVFMVIPYLAYSSEITRPIVLLLYAPLLMPYTGFGNWPWLLIPTTFTIFAVILYILTCWSLKKKLRRGVI